MTPLDIILVLVLMAKVLLERSDELTDMVCILAVEYWWLFDISIGIDAVAVLVTPSLLTV